MKNVQPEGKKGYNECHDDLIRAVTHGFLKLPNKDSYKTAQGEEGKGFFVLFRRWSLLVQPAQPEE